MTLERDELDRFKQEVNLEALACVFGYERDDRESTASGAIYRRKDGDAKLSIVCGKNGQWVYYDFRTEQGGSVLDFVKMETGESLGHIRRRLRDFLRTDHPLQVEHFTPNCPKSTCEEPDRKKCQAVWDESIWTPNATYLLGRGLSLATMSDERFMDTFRISGKGEVRFIHRDRVGLTGYEKRGEGVKGFMSSGHKAFWYSNNLKTANQIVICESGINALSHCQLFAGDSAYLSFAGTISSRQRDLFSGLFAKASKRGAQIIIATDNDDAGHGYFEALSLLSPEPMLRAVPAGKDWNDDLSRVLRETG